MSKKRKIISLAVLGVLLLASLALSLLPGKGGAKESLQTIMRDAVLHEDNKISLFGLMDVNPAVVSGFIVTGVLLALAALARIFVIPRFKYKPGKLQLLLEELVTFFQNLAQTNSPHRNGFLGAYLFGAGVYVLFGTLFELFGLQAVTTAGGSISLPAPLSDINAAISVGCMSYLVILGGGIQAPRRCQHAQGFLASHLHELPSVRRAAERSAGHGACLLFAQPELCAAGIRGRHVHAPARAHSDVCPDDTRVDLLW